MTSTAELVTAPRESFGRLFLRFLRFELLARGGPVAQIAMHRCERVDEHCVSNEWFNGTRAAYRAPMLGAWCIDTLCIHKRIFHARYTDTRAPNRPAAAHS